MSKLEISLTQKETTKIVQIEGTLDEDFIFKKYPLEDASEIEFYLGNLKHINSCGIREWIKWLDTIKGHKTKFYECPKMFVDQINMVQGFLPENGIIESFYVPYFNEDSGSEKSVLFSRGHEFSGHSGEIQYPTDIKDENNQPMEMDVIAAKYFKFLKKTT